MSRKGMIADAYHSTARVAGLTHGLYRYPARFSPELVRAAIETYTEPGDWIADPFVGGGTTAVEALASARRVIAFDVNPLSVLLTGAKTTPLSRQEISALRSWALLAHAGLQGTVPEVSLDPRLHNAPAHLSATLEPLRLAIDQLPSDRSRAAARSILVHAGQQLIDGRIRPGESAEVPKYVDGGLARLLEGLAELKRQAGSFGLRPSDLGSRRVVRLGRAHELAPRRPFNRLVGRVRLVVTSPPYPGIHVLYHRWQVHGRTETPMAYWLSDLQDGLGPKHYTMGGRTGLGDIEYFETIAKSWAAVRRLLAPDATVVQVVAFSDPERQLNQYLASMTAAGYTRLPEAEPESWRVVPNRKWYYRTRPERAQAQEVLLVHRPAA